MIIYKVTGVPAPTSCTLTDTPGGMHYILHKHITVSDVDNQPILNIHDDYVTDIDCDTIRAAPDFSDYAVFIRGFTQPADVIRNFGLGLHRLCNLFTATKSSCMTLDDFLHVQKVSLLMMVIIPFADSPVSDWVLAIPAGTETTSVIYTGETLTAVSFAQVMDNHLPRVRIVPVSRDDKYLTFQVSVSDPSLQPVANVRPWVFLDTTLGVLLHSRIQVSPGIPALCKVDVSGIDVGTTGKIKVGWKHFSGAAEYTFTV